MPPDWIIFDFFLSIKLNIIKTIKLFYFIIFNREVPEFLWLSGSVRSQSALILSKFSKLSFTGYSSATISHTNVFQAKASVFLLIFL